MKGSTAVTPAPVLHEFHDGSIASAAKEALVSARTNAHAEGVLAVTLALLLLTFAPVTACRPVLIQPRF